ncbi:MAG: chromosome partitioning protein ParB, partial [Deltaproteobacteria bacterium]|nr:chromosome partitioning protein ParB [Deltaproteobacteria bacterium]
NHADLDKAAFWDKMAKKSWVYPYDESGRGPRPVSDLPHTVDQMTDDPYRSLAGEVRSAGGYQKSEVPFTEFIWANFFRTRIPAKELNSDFDQAVKDGVKLAHTSAAKALPGYTKD